MAHAVPHYGAGPTGALSARRGTARHRPVCNNPSRPIADFFVLTCDIGGQGQERHAGRGERLQEPEERQGGKHRSRGEEKERIREDERRARGGDSDDGEDCDDGPGERETGPPCSGKQ